MRCSIPFLYKCQVKSVLWHLKTMTEGLQSKKREFDRCIYASMKRINQGEPTIDFYLINSKSFSPDLILITHTLSSLAHSLHSRTKWNYLLYYTATVDRFSTFAVWDMYLKRLNSFISGIINGLNINCVYTAITHALSFDA